GIRGHSQVAAKIDTQFEVHEHVRLKCEIRIWKFNTHLHGACFWIKCGRDKYNPPSPPIEIRAVGQLNLYCLTNLQEGQIGFVGFAEYPNAGEVHEGI